MTKSRLYFKRKLRLAQLETPHPSPVTILKFTIISWAKGLEDLDLDRVPISLTPTLHKLKVYSVTVLVMKLENLETRLIVYPNQHFHYAGRFFVKYN